MKQKTYRTLSLLLLFSVMAGVLTACQQMTAEQIIKEVTDRSKNVQTLQYDLQMKVSASGLTYVADGTGAMKMPDQAYIKYTMMNQAQELVLLGTDVYSRQDAKQAWQKSSLADLTKNQALPNLQGFKPMFDFTNLVNNPTREADEKVGDVDCYHVRFDLDIQKVLDAVGKASGQDVTGQLQGALDSSNMQAKMDLWVGKNDLLAHRELMSLAFKITPQGMTAPINGALAMDIKIPTYNQAVDIPDPLK